MGTDIKKTNIPGLDLSITNLSEKNDSGFGVQQKNCVYSSNMANEVFLCFFPAKQKLRPYLNVLRAYSGSEYASLNFKMLNKDVP